MALIPTLISFAPNTVIKSSEVNSNLTAIRDAFNNTAVLTDVARTIAVAVTVSLGAITTDQKVYEGSATWNNAGVTFNGIKLNITDTASAAGSLLLNLQTGGSNRFLVGKDARIGVNAALPTTALVAVGGTMPSVIVAADQSAFSVDVIGTSGGTSTIRGVNSLVRTPSALATGTLVGFHASAHVLGGGGSTATNAAGYVAVAQTVGTNNVAFWAVGGAHAGTNAYGLLVGNITGAVNNFAIKTGTGLVELGDTLRFTVAATKIVPGATSLSLRNNADSADNLLLTDAGLATFRNTITTTPSVGGKGLVILGATQTTDQPVLDLAQTWNAAGVAFTALKLNVTNTASAAGALLVDLQTGGTPRFQVAKSGAITLDAGAGTSDLGTGVVTLKVGIGTAGSLTGVGIAGFGNGAASGYSNPAVFINAGTVTSAATPSATLDIAETWNNAGGTHRAIKVNITVTASASASKLLDLQTGGTTRCEVDRFGSLRLTPSSTADGASLKNNTTGASIVCASAALATTATIGFLYVPTCAGVPTGTPTAQTGTVALVFDTTNNKLMIYDGAWIGVTLA